jgi:hypothetical protein
MKVARVNVGPLLTPWEMSRIKPERVMRALTREILKNIRLRVQQEPFSSEAKRALSEGMKVIRGPSSITVIATHPAFRPLLEGQRKGQMKWLTKARAPIPIVTEDGELIFRWATPRSMKNGRWVHPGHEPTTVIEKAREETREIVRDRMKKELAKQIRAAFAKGAKKRRSK